MITIENETNIIKEKLLEHNDMINEIFNKFDKKEEFENKIFFDGEIYDSYSLLIDIIRKAKQNIIIIDNYVDKILLDILSKKNINVIVLLITDKNKSVLTNSDIEKFNKQYPNLHIKYTEKFHDRFIIIDKIILYHLGASLKDLGNKIFAINHILDPELLNKLLFKINM